MPERFLLQILRKLVKRGILESTCGVAGGYYLLRSPQQISLRDIVEAFDNPLDITLPALECMSPAIQQRVLQTLRDVSQAARAELQKLTVADLLQSEASNGPRTTAYSNTPPGGDFPPIYPTGPVAQASDSPVIR